MRLATGKSYWITYALTVALLVAAPHAAAAKTPFDGFYAGLPGGHETYDLDLRSGSPAADNLNLSGLTGEVYAGANTAVHGRERSGDCQIRPGQNLLAVGAGWYVSIADVSEAHGLPPGPKPSPFFSLSTGSTR